MKLYSWKEITFEKEYIIINSKKDKSCIKIKDIWTLFYAKWTYINFMSLAHERFGMGYLYIAKKDCMTYHDIIRIRFPYKQLEHIPPKIFNMIDFYKWNEYQDIFKIWP